MKIFEFSFNPKRRKDRFLQTYSFEPKSSKEKPKGSLYIIGELDNALEFNSTFLKRLAQSIQSEYYSSSLKTASSALKAALKKANKFLTQENKKGNVDWLGNLHIAILLFITMQEKKTVFHLAKTGKIKVLMMRDKILTDIGKNLEIHSSKQPGKVFGNVASGNLMPRDSVLVSTTEIFDALAKEQSLGEFGKLSNAKQFRDFFSNRSRMLAQVSGIITSYIIEEEQAKRAPVKKSLIPAFLKSKILLPKKRQMNPPKIFLKLPYLKNRALIKRKATLLLLLAVLLLLGYLFF